MIPLHLDSLDINRQKVFRELKAFQPDGILAGGTDIALQIGQRGKWRDYVDLYFLLKSELVTLDQIINDCSKRTNGETFPVKLFLEQLVYFEDLTVSDIYFIGPTIEPREIKKFLSLCVDEYNHNQLS